MIQSAAAIQSEFHLLRKRIESVPQHIKAEVQALREKVASHAEVQELTEKLKRSAGDVSTVLEQQDLAERMAKLELQVGYMSQQAAERMAKLELQVRYMSQQATEIVDSLAYSRLHCTDTSAVSAQVSARAPFIRPALQQQMTEMQVLQSVGMPFGQNYSLQQRHSSMCTHEHMQPQQPIFPSHRSVSWHDDWSDVWV